MDEELNNRKKEDEIYCTSCSKLIKKDFVICPYCRKEIKREKKEDDIKIRAVSTKTQNAQSDRAKRNRVILVTIILVLIIAGMVGLCSRCFSSTKTDNEQSKMIEALVYSQSAVAEELKAPSSAKFPLITDSLVEITKLSTDKYSVFSYVDSENSFGAIVRVYYTCTVTLLEGDRYRVEDLEFSE